MVVGSMVGSASLIARCLATAKVNGLCKTGDVCVVISGIQEVYFRLRVFCRLPTSRRRHMACRMSVIGVREHARRPQAMCLVKCLRKHVMRVGLASNEDRRWYCCACCAVCVAPGMCRCLR